MSPSLITVLTDNCDYPSQPRSNPDPAYCRGLGENMKAIGQQVPIIGYTDPAILSPFQNRVSVINITA